MRKMNQTQMTMKKKQKPVRKLRPKLRPSWKGIAAHALIKLHRNGENVCTAANQQKYRLPGITCANNEDKLDSEELPRETPTTNEGYIHKETLNETSEVTQNGEQDTENWENKLIEDNP